jgi:hypothetical protein
MDLAPRATAIPAPYVVPATQTFDGDDGSWSTFFIHVGTPGQDFRVLPSTSSGETWVPVPEACTSDDPSNCASLRGAQPFHGAASSGFLTNASSTWELIGLYSLDLEAGLGYTGNGEYGFDTLGLGTSQDASSLSLERQVIAGIADKSYYMGILALGIRPSSFSNTASPVSTFLTNLRDNGTIPSLSYGYTAGAPYREQPDPTLPLARHAMKMKIDALTHEFLPGLKTVPGQLILGGYDSTRFSPLDPTFSFSFSSDSTRPLTVGVQSIIASNTLIGVTSFTISGHLSLIDSTVPHLWLPSSVCDLMAAAFGLTYDNSTDLYLINDSMHARLQSLNPTVTIKLGNTAYTSSNNTNIELPYSAFDLTCSPPLCSNTTNYFPIRRAANESQYVLGRTLLQEAYLIVDYERSNFTVAQNVWPDPLPDSHVVAIISPSSTNTGSGGSPSSLPLGALIGIAIGGSVLLLAFAVLLWLWLRHRRHAAEQANLADAAVAETEHGFSGQTPDIPEKPAELGITSPSQPELAGDSRAKATRLGYFYESEPQEMDSPMARRESGPHEMLAPDARHELPASTYWEHGRGRRGGGGIGDGEEDGAGHGTLGQRRVDG